MQRILVTTDFSANSKKAIRFAIQLASQTNIELLFYNVVVGVSIPSAFSNLHYTPFDALEVKKHQKKLEKFIETIYKDSNLTPINYKCVCELGNGIGNKIISYAKESKADFICVSARGAGVLNKLFGTTSSHLITDSPIPVFVIPNNYRIQPIKTICYASDIENIDMEIREVIALATSVKAKVKVLHYDYAVHLKGDKEKLNALALKYETDDINFHYRKTNPISPLNDQLREGILVMKPSLVVLFTKQNRSWFDRLFEPTTSTDMSFNAKTPLLVFRKKTNKMDTIR
ncbi:Nucleotide-binding universal stress protein, UspA family [Flavobacterium swingsii]|jgi:nucleotide-binding universal stress UspA family protein|uniref:Nucleotide-binding universal stress protein, UspA family n=1 Tax=Flavobacterium swingsii TaxID=498292 RepID=A0A1I0WUW1_9FLAO|nr:universal stress protein [Flavobacterium swingsii]SFA92562.1 Nucleotide-binding universal stress protein, UspA family [Flavobacterium swingsii]